MHNNNIINLLKLEGVKFINLEEQGETTTLFFKSISSELSFVEKYKRITHRAIQYIITKLKKLNFKVTGLESPKVLHIDEFKVTSDARKYLRGTEITENTMFFKLTSSKIRVGFLEYKF